MKTQDKTQAKTAAKIITISLLQLIIVVVSLVLLPLWFAADIITLLQNWLESKYERFSTSKRIIASREKINRRFNML
jgi:hypothetical protein